jgi:hypothetical protein
MLSMPVVCSSVLSISATRQFGGIELTDLDVFADFSRDDRDTGVQPQGFLYAAFKVLHFVEVLHGEAIILVRACEAVDFVRNFFLHKDYILNIMIPPWCK